MLQNAHTKYASQFLTGKSRGDLLLITKSTNITLALLETSVQGESIIQEVYQGEPGSSSFGEVKLANMYMHVLLIEADCPQLVSHKPSYGAGVSCETGIFAGSLHVAPIVWLRSLVLEL